MKEKFLPLKLINLIKYALKKAVCTSDFKESRDRLLKRNNYKKDLLNQNPMSFYHRNSNAIVQHILKTSENSVLNNMSRNKI